MNIHEGQDLIHQAMMNYLLKVPVSSDPTLNLSKTNPNPSMHGLIGLTAQLNPPHPPTVDGGGLGWGGGACRKKKNHAQGRGERLEEPVWTKAYRTGTTPFVFFDDFTSARSSWAAAVERRCISCLNSRSPPDGTKPPQVFIVKEEPFLDPVVLVSRDSKARSGMCRGLGTPERSQQSSIVSQYRHHLPKPPLASISLQR